ncbi:MAG: hypothetical protein ACE5HQ_03965 [Gemmatimonadota bacterium]
MRANVRVIGVLAGALLVGACTGLGGPAGVPDNQTQVWRFDLLDANGNVGTSGTGDCLPGGACGPFDWTVLTQQSFGCTLVYRFQVQFSGDQVRIFLGQMGPGTTCSGMMLGQNFGNGQADAAYPAAKSAGGTVTIKWNSPIGPGGGAGNWTARRIG